jgi:4'-phosphopantetheinyl transferase
MVSCTLAVTERQFEWPYESSGIVLFQNDLHLWIVDVPGLEKSGHFRLLTKSERDRSTKILDQDKRLLYLGGRVGLRLLLSGYTQLNNSSLEFGIGEKGKPKLLNTLEEGKLMFNYTVSSRYALYGFAWNRELGVDLETIPRNVDGEAMARRTLTDLEQQSWKTIQEDQKNNAMLACWTRKEAYGKALGVGIRYAMNQVPLFVDLHRDEWETEVRGLFDGEQARNQDRLKGIQLGLPVPGVAAVMFAAATGSNRGQPELSAFQLRNNET